jgi:ribosomal protein S18 acetylase RimI-like enzyme
MARIRNYEPRDLETVYRICLETGSSGKDATHLYRDPKVIGHIYAGPYVTLEPRCAFVLEDDEGVGGYIIGAFDTHTFEKRQEEEWWPDLRRTYADPSGKAREAWSIDERMAYLIHHSPRTPRRVSEPYPSHLHIDLLPRFQGKGFGQKMIDHWLDAMRAMGSRGMHLGVGTANERAVRFYEAYGLKVIEKIPAPYNVIYFGTELGNKG